MKVSTRAALVSAVEMLESRRLFAVTVETPFADVAVRPNASNSSIALGGVFKTTNLDSVTGTVVRFPVEAGSGASKLSGSINIELFTQTPLTSQNFLNYVNSGRYNEVFFHRSVKDFVIQTGGFKAPDGTAIATDPKLQNEFSLSPRNTAGKVNTRGTIAMAKLGGDPNSATSQWFINLNDNSSNLDNQNGGFTTFGRVFSGGMALADQIAALQVVNAGGTFSDLPVASYTSGQIQGSNLVVFKNPAVVAAPKTNFTYSVTSSDGAVVAATVDGGNLVLDYGTKVGASTITVSATDLTGATVTDTFSVTVASPALGVSFNGANLTAGQAATVDVGQAFVGQAATRQLLFRNTGTGPISITGVNLPAGFNLVGTAPTNIAAGQQVLLEFSVDTATSGVKEGTISIATDAVNAVNGVFAFSARSEVGSGVTLGTGGSKSIVFTDGDGTRATFSLRGTGAARFEFSGDGLAVNTVKGVSTIAGTNLNVVNIGMSGGGASTVLSVALRGGNRLINVGTVSSETVIRSLAFKGVNVTESLSLPVGVGDLTVSGINTATVNLSQTAPTSSVRSLLLGDVTGSTINVAGAVRTITAGVVSDTAFVVGGTVSALNATSISGSTFSAGAVSAIAVRGAVSGTELTAGGIVARASVGAFTSSSLRVGVVPGVPTPDSVSDYATPSAISQFTITSRVADSFSNSTLIASNLGRLRLGQLTSAGGQSRIIGVTAQDISGTGELRRPFSVKRVSATTDVDSLLTAAGIPTTRLDVDMLA